MAKSHIGKVAVITGAASGIGQTFAKRLAEDGAAIVIADRQLATETVALVQTTGSRVLAVPCDVSSEKDVAALARAVHDAFGRCDILVNNAGIYPIQPFDELTFEDWRRVMAINLDAQFLTVKAFAPGMRQRRWGRIVNLASNTFNLVLPGFVHYIASKGGVIGLTRALANEFGADGVTVNAIAPGLTRTPGTLGRNVPPGMRDTDPFGAAAERQAIRRGEMPADLAGAVSFLTSDDAAFITGQTLYVDGGQVRV